MRNGQNNKRMRGRSRKSQNPLTRVFESNGPDIKIRGTASHIAEKYLQLARDAQTSGDPVSGENYLQHAEHYFRLIAAAQEQFRQSQPFRPEGEARDDGEDDGDDEGDGPSDYPHAPRQHQPQQHQNYQQREHQHQNYQRENQPREYQHRDHQHRDHQHREHQPREHQPREHQPYGMREPQPQPQFANRPHGESNGEGDQLPSFITGGGGNPQPQQANAGYQNGHDGQGERFPLHRRRRRRHGPRDHNAPQGGGSDSADDSGGPSTPHTVE